MISCTPACVGTRACSSWWTTRACCSPFSRACPPNGSSPPSPPHLARSPREGSAAPLETNKTPDACASLCSAQDLIDAANATGAALVAVPDAYYPTPKGRALHHLQTAIKHNALLADLPPAWLAPEPAHLPAYDELARLYAEIPDAPGAWPVHESPALYASCPPIPPSAAAENPKLTAASATSGPPAPLVRSVQLAERCRYTPPLGGVLFPRIDLAEGETPYSRLCSLAFDGARQRYRPLGPEVLERLQYELSTIQNLGFAPYFLLVNQIGEFARDAGIPTIGRGSAADSLVAFCLGLTDADPFRYRLPFERFLNPARKDRPDIDLDFCWRRRDEVLEHVFELFGPERTAMISTLIRFGARSAFRQAALAHGIPPAEFERWSRRIPMYGPGASFDGTAAAGEDPAEEGDESLEAGRPAGSLEAVLRSLPDLREFPFDDARFAAVLRDADRLLDVPRHFGLHPGGVVVAPATISEALACAPSSKGPVVTQFDKHGVEDLGLVKMDLLGNRALTTLHDAQQMLASRGITIDWQAIAEDDAPTAEILRRGATLGCFQIESPGMRHLLQQTGACTMDDVIQAVALIRPGPAQAGMKEAYVRRFRGHEDPAPPHPCLAPVLADTYGILLYQEDVMQVAAVAAGMDLASADQLRRALQKRKHDELPALRARFFDGCASRGLTPEDAEHLWERIEGFASFAFCKAHAVTYGRIAYRAAWLKAHHPIVFLTAFLNSETGYYATRVYVEEARRLGARILGPDVNHSGREFDLEDLPGARVGLRLGWNQVHGLSEHTTECLLAERERRPFLSLPDFLERTGAHRDETETLIRCGAFDAFDRTRPELLWRLHLLRQPVQRAPREAGLDHGTLSALRRRPPAEGGLVQQSPSSGWNGQGIGLGATRLEPGAEASLFAPPPDRAPVLPGLPDWNDHERGRFEHDLLGVSLHHHPTRLFPCPGETRWQAARKGPRDRRAPLPPRPCADIATWSGTRITLRGWLAASRRVRTTAGTWMRFLTLEDESGLAEAILFPDVYTRTAPRVRSDEVLLVSGTVEDQMGSFALRVENIW
ncbi:MAG: DNA polymerase III subunit alpha [Planctomycetota bacterium]